MSDLMHAADRAEHWNSVWRTKADAEVSWFESEPRISLDLIDFCAARSSPAGTLRILDIGGGSSLLALRLAQRGDQVTVVDISAAALQRARQKSGDSADHIRWVIADITAVEDLGACDIWHDRAVFHFLTADADRARYVQRAGQTVVKGGWLVVGTFADDGPQQCSGLPVQRYGEDAMRAAFAPQFEAVQMRRAGHLTPWGKDQRFLWAVFRKRA